MLALGSIKCDAAFQAPAGDYPPYPVWGGNEYQGWLWTMDNDKFDRTDVRASPATLSPTVL